MIKTTVANRVEKDANYAITEMDVPLALIPIIFLTIHAHPK